MVQWAKMLVTKFDDLCFNPITWWKEGCFLSVGHWPPYNTHTYTHVHTHTHAYTHTFILTYTHIYSHLHTHLPTHSHIHTHTPTLTDTLTHTHRESKQIDKHNKNILG